MENLMKKYVFFLITISFLMSDQDSKFCSSSDASYRDCKRENKENCHRELNDLLDCKCANIQDLNQFRCCRARELEQLEGCEPDKCYSCVKCVSYKPAKDVFKDEFNAGQIENPEHPVKTYTFRSACEGGCLKREKDEGCHLRWSPCLSAGKHKIKKEVVLIEDSPFSNEEIILESESR